MSKQSRKMNNCFKSLIGGIGGETKAKGRTDGDIFYHYTSRRAADSISREGKIRTKGNGVLLTTMAPERYYRSEILNNNYGDNISPRLQNRADHCVRILPSKLIGSKLYKNQLCSGRLIYLYDGDILVREQDVFDKPSCRKSLQTIQSDVQQPSSSSGASPDRKPTHSACDVNDKSGVALGKSNIGISNEIKIHLRRDIKSCQRYQEHQDATVTIYAFEWMKDGLETVRKTIGKEISVNIEDCKRHNIPSESFSLKHLQMVSRNESSNTNGEIDFGNYSGISQEVVYSLKDLNRQTVIIGKDRTTNYGGYPHTNKRVPQNDLVYVCDLIGLQFQQKYNSGRLVLVGEHLPKGLLDEFIYEQVVKEKKPTMEEVRSDHSGRFIECGGVFFDSKAYKKFVANDVLLAGIGLNSCSTEPLNFKFLKFGTGYFAGPFRHLLDRFIGQGVAEGLQNLLKFLPENHRIKRVELPFFDQCPSIGLVCYKHNVELKYSTDDALKTTRWGCTTATTNSADPHASTGNAMGFGSVDGAIAENLNGKAIKFSPIVNELIKECFVKN